MQISDLFHLLSGQSNVSKGSSTTGNNQTKSGETAPLSLTLAQMKGANLSLLDFLSSLTPGKYFEGTVLKMNQNKVTIGLENGQQVQAKLSGNPKLEMGQAMFFEVKSLTKNEVIIRPLTDQTSENPTFLKALKQANLVPTEKNLILVKSMMEAALPIDKQSLMKMAKEMSIYPQVDPKILVDMAKSNIPISNENINQFQNYRSDQYTILNSVNEMITQVQQEESPKILRQIVNTLIQDKEMTLDNGLLNHSERPEEGIHTTSQMETSSVKNQATSPEIGSRQQLELSQQIDQMVDSKFNEIQKGSMETLKEALTSKDPLVQEALERFFSSKEGKQIVSQLITQQWSILPEQVTKESVRELYETLFKQVNEIENLFTEQGQTSTIKEAAASIRQNINFIQSFTQVLSYVQIPLKLEGKQVHSELYVYSKNKGKRLEKEEISAFLHLELDHLGTTDVAVKLMEEKVNLKFYLDSEKLVNLLEVHLDSLEQRLKEKGYQVVSKVSSQEDAPDLMTHLWSTDQGEGILHRYSFDARA